LTEAASQSLWWSPLCALLPASAGRNFNPLSKLRLD
jgi:hypothetical protein